MDVPQGCSPAIFWGTARTSPQRGAEKTRRIAWGYGDVLVGYLDPPRVSNSTPGVCFWCFFWVPNFRSFKDSGFRHTYIYIYCFMAGFDAFHIHCLQYKWWTVSCWDLKFPSFKWCCLCGWSRGAYRWTKTLWFQEGKDPFINPSCWLLLWGAKMWRSIAKMPRIWSLPLGCWCIWGFSPSHEVPLPPEKLHWP